MPQSRLPAVLLVAALLFTFGCGSPPSKEMDQAQGAIDAARAAGAEQYATTEYTAATTALNNAHAAVAARDYRLALNHALASHEHAQNAARETADAKAAMRAGAERIIAEFEMSLAQADARLTAAPRGRLSQRQRAESTRALDAIRAELQKAREAVDGGDYLSAHQELEGMRARIDEVMMAITSATAPPPPRRRR